MANIRDDAVVLRRIPFRDTSLVVHLFTRYHGLVPAVARGARANKSPCRAALAGLHGLTVDLHLRSVEGLATLTGAEITDPRHGLARQAWAMAGAQLAVEAAYRGLPPGDANPPLFQILSQVLTALDQGRRPSFIVAVGLARMMTALGYGFGLDQCGRCGLACPPSQLAPEQGMMLCDSCARHEPCVPLSAPLARALSCQTMTERELSPRELALLYHVSMTGLERHGEEKLLADPIFRQHAGWPASHAPAGDAGTHAPVWSSLP